MPDWPLEPEIEEIEVPAVPEPDEPDDGAIDPDDTYEEGSGDAA